MGKVYLRRTKNSTRTYFVLRKGKRNRFIKTIKKYEQNPTTGNEDDQQDLVQDEIEFEETEQSSNISNVTGEDIQDSPSMSYKYKKEKRLKHWQEIYTTLRNTGTSTIFLPPVMTCCLCGNVNTSVIYRCQDCGPTAYFCETCLENQHRIPHLHKFEVFKNGTFLDYNCPSPIWARLDSHTCDTSYVQDILVLDEKGRQHKRRMEFCHCESRAERMIRFFLWPSSPKNPSIGFHIHLLELMTNLLYESHVSAKSFCQVIQHDKNGLLDTGVKDIYKILMNECLVQFRKFNHEIKHPKHILNIDDGMSCPACYKNPQTVISFDADFQLVRKFSAGQSSGKTEQGGFFIKQIEVDKYVENYAIEREAVKEKECSEFQAGSALRSKGKNQKLDEKAVFGSICRHEFPVRFFSLKHGERLCYSVFLIERLLMENEDTELSVMYDIACRLNSHLKANDRNDILNRITLAIPIFHGYAHKMSCQVLFNPRRLPGFGLTDGESVERMWSYLGKFSTITKEMTPENRVNLLNMALVFYGEKVTSKLGQTLSRKFNRAESLQFTSERLLNELLLSLNGYTKEDVKEWSMDEIKQHQEKRDVTEETYTPFEDYVMKLEKFSSLKQSLLITEDHGEIENIKTHIKRIEKELTKYEKKRKCARLLVNCEEYISAQRSINVKKYTSIYGKIKKLMVERLFFLQLMKKYAKGQAVAIRLSKQLKRINNCIKTKIKEYNSCPGAKQDPFPNVLNFNDMDSKIDILTNSTLTQDTKRMAIDLYETILRCTEEKSMIKTEINCCIQYFERCHQSLTEQLLIFDEQSSVERSVIINKGLVIEYSLKQLLNLVPKDIFTITEVRDTFQNITQMESEISEQIDTMLVHENSVLGIDIGNMFYSDEENDSDYSDEENDSYMLAAKKVSDDVMRDDPIE